MILVLEYFRDPLANVGLLGVWLEYDSVCVTRIKNKYVRCESNRIEEKKLSLIKFKKTIESNQIKNNWVKYSRKRLPERSCVFRW